MAELAEVPERPHDAVLGQIAELRRIAIVPALNEEESVGRVIDELRAFDPGFDIVVVDDGSTDRTAGIAADRGAHVVRLPFNLGIGGAVQTGYRFAFEHGYDIAVQVDGDGQHDPAQLPTILAPVVTGQADLCVGSRFASGSGYQSSFTRRLGIKLFAWVVSAVVGQKVTDTTSGFRAVNRKGIALFAADYPARRRGLVDHRAALDLLHDESAARDLRRPLSPLRRPAREGATTMTPLPVSIASAVASFLLLVVVFELIRSRRLRERYALLWLLTGGVLLALSVWRDGLNTIAGWFGVETYPPAILGAVGALFILIVLLHYSTVISRLSDQNTILAQRLALLEQQQREGVTEASR